MNFWHTYPERNHRRGMMRVLFGCSLLPSTEAAHSHDGVREKCSKWGVGRSRAVQLAAAALFSVHVRPACSPVRLFTRTDERTHRAGAPLSLSLPLPLPTYVRKNSEDAGKNEEEIGRGAERGDFGYAQIAAVFAVGRSVLRWMRAIELLFRTTYGPQKIDAISESCTCGFGFAQKWHSPVWT